MSKEVGGMVGSRRVQGAESAPTARRLGRWPWRPGSGGARAGNGTWFLADDCNRSNNPPQNQPPRAAAPAPPSDDEMNRYDMHGRSLSGCPGALRRRAVTPRSRVPTGTTSMRDHSDRVRAAGWESGTTRGPSPTLAAVAPPEGYDSEARRSGRAF